LKQTKIQEQSKTDKQKLKLKTSKNNRKSTLELAVREIRVDLRGTSKKNSEDQNEKMLIQTRSAR